MITIEDRIESKTKRDCFFDILSLDDSELDRQLRAIRRKYNKDSLNWSSGLYYDYKNKKLFYRVVSDHFDRRNMITLIKYFYSINDPSILKLKGFKKFIVESIESENKEFLSRSHQKNVSYFYENGISIEYLNYSNALEILLYWLIFNKENFFREYVISGDEESYILNKLSSKDLNIIVNKIYYEDYKNTYEYSINGQTPFEFYNIFSVLDLNKAKDYPKEIKELLARVVIETIKCNDFNQNQLYQSYKILIKLDQQDLLSELYEFYKECNDYYKYKILSIYRVEDNLYLNYPLEIEEYQLELISSLYNVYLDGTLIKKKKNF